MNTKLPKESLALLKKNGVPEEVFFAWLTAKYQFIYNITRWTFFAFFEIFFTYTCWEFYQKSPEARSVAMLFWLALNLCIILPLAWFTNQKKIKTRNNLTIQAMNLSYIFYYTDPKKLVHFSPHTWEKIRNRASTQIPTNS